VVEAFEVRDFKDPYTALDQQTLFPPQIVETCGVEPS
jgi:hypothetical protein